MYAKHIPIKLDFTRKLSVPRMEFVQGDTRAYIFDFYLTDDGSTVSVDLTGCTVNVVFEKGDNTNVTGTATVTGNNTAEYELGTQELAFPGTVAAEVQVYGVDSRITTMRFNFSVREELNDGEAIASTTEYSTLTELMNRETVREQNEDSRKAAELTRVSQESTRQTQETSRQTAESSRNTEFSSWRGEHNLWQSDHDTWEAYEQVRQGNETNRITNESARIQAEVDRHTVFEANEVSRQGAFDAHMSAWQFSIDDAEYVANTAASNAQTQADYAKSEGDYAKSQGDYAKTQGDYAKSKGDIAQTAADNANNAATNITTAKQAALDAASTSATNEAIRQSQESGRVTAENNRQTTEVNRNNNFSDMMEFFTLYAPDSSFNMTTEVDGSGNIVKKKFSDVNGVLRDLVERLNFNASKKPQLLKRKTFDAYGKGTKYSSHVLAYDANGKMTSDTVTDNIGYESADLTTTRAGKAMNPLKTYNYTGGVLGTDYFGNNALTVQPSASVANINNDISSLEIRGDKILTTFSTGKQETFNIANLPFVGGDTESFPADFSTKVANSNLECPLKIFSQSVDPANLPKPPLDATVLNNPATVTLTAVGGGTIPAGTYTYGVVAYNANGESYVKTASITTVSTGSIKIDWTVPSVGTPTGYKISDRVNNKIYDAGNVLTYTDTGAMPNNSDTWKEIVNQSILDKLKSQNEVPISAVTPGSFATWNGKKLVPQGSTLNSTVDASFNSATWGSTAVALHDDFASKTNGNITVNPHIAKHNYSGSQSSLMSPSSFTTEVANSFYTALNSIDGNTDGGIKVTTLGAIPQNLLSFNIIAALEQKYGSLPVQDTTSIAQKVAWAKGNLKSVKCDAYIYGLSNGINKAYLSVYAWNTWNVQATIPNSSVTKASGGLYTSSDLANGIQPDGFVHFLAYTDAVSVDGNTATIYTDYVSLDVQLKAPQGYDLYVPTNPRRDAVSGTAYDNIVEVKKVYASQTSDFNGITSPSSTNKFYRTFTDSTITSLVTPSQLASPPLGITEADAGYYTVIQTQDNNNAQSSTKIAGAISQDIFQFPLIQIFESAYGTIPAVDKVAWLKANINYMTLNWYGFGSCPTGNIAKVTPYINGKWDNYFDTNNINTASTSTLTQIGMDANYIKNAIQSDGTLNILAYSNPSDGTIPSVINTDYVKLTITYVQPVTNDGIEFFTQRSVDVDVITNNKAACYLLEWDMSAIATYLGGNAALKSAIKALYVDIYATASGVNNGVLTNGADAYKWDTSTNTWRTSSSYWKISNTTSLISKMSFAQDGGTTSSDVAQKEVTANNKIYTLVCATNPSDSVISSSVNLDFVSLRADFGRIADNVASMPVYLPSTWSVLLKFSPNWDINDKIDRYILKFIKDNNVVEFKKFGTTPYYRFVKSINGNTTGINITIASLLKNQVTGALITQGTNSLFMRLLKNNGSLETISIADSVQPLTGVTNLYVCESNGMLQQADAFLPSLVFLPGYVPADDTVATNMLNGTQAGFENSELFDITKIGLNNTNGAVTTLSGTTLTLTSTADDQSSGMMLNVLPNNRYEAKCTVTGYVSSSVKPYVIPVLYSGSPSQSVFLGYGYSSSVFTGNGTFTFQFTTPYNCNLVHFRCGNKGVGTFTFSNISLKRKD